MADDTSNGPALVSMAQQFSGLPMHALIGSPLMAAAQANNMMAMTQVDYLLSTCFKASAAKQGDPESYEPIMVNLQMTRQIISSGKEQGDPPNVTPETTTLQLPILTILPLNSLAVDSVDVDFEMEVKSSYAKATAQSKSDDLQEQGSFKAKMGYGPFSVSVSGSISHDSKSSSSENTHYQKSNSAKYNVAVHAGQLPLPPGVGTIIQAFTNNMAPIKADPSKG